MTLSAAQRSGRSASDSGTGEASTSGEWWWVAGVFLVGFGLRWVAVFRAATIFNDGPTFLLLAGQMGAGEWRHALAHPYHPLYPFLIQAIGSVFDDPATVAVGISLISGSLSVVVLYALLRQIWPHPLAATGAFLLAIHPYAIRFSADVQSDSLYMLLFLSSVALLLRELERPSFLLALLFGSVVSLAYLARPEGLAVGLVALATVGLFWLRGLWSGASSVVAVAGFAAGIVLPAIPYAWMLKSLTGGWQLTQKKSVLVLLGFAPGGSGGPLDFGLFFGLGPWQLGACGAALAVLLAYAAWAVRRSGKLNTALSSARLWRGVLVGLIGLALVSPPTLFDLSLSIISTLRPEFVLLLILGVMAGGLRTGRPAAGLISLLLVVFGLTLFALLLQYGYVSRRHLLPPLTLLLGYCAVGVHYAADWLAGQRIRGLPWLLGHRSRAFVLVLALMVAIILPKAWKDYRAEEFAGRLAAEWLRDSPERSGFVASRLSKLGYYAGREWRPLESDGKRQALSRLWAEGVRFVIVEPGITGDWSADQDPSDGFILVERHRAKARGSTAFVLELVGADSAL